jgi:hypothetical protein
MIMTLRFLEIGEFDGYLRIYELLKDDCCNGASQSVRWLVG